MQLQDLARVLVVDGKIYGATPYYACKAALCTFRQPPKGFHAVARQWGTRLLQFADVSAEARDADRVDWSRPTVLMANHASLYDIPLLFHTIPADLNFLAKKEIRRVPFMGWSMERGGFVFIDRRHPVRSKQSIDSAAAKVQAGDTVAIFPEGTRTRDGALRDFKKGGFVLAIKGRAQIAPVFIDGSYSILPYGSALVRPGHVEVRVGHPIDASGLALDDKERLMEQVRAELEALSRVPPLRPTGAHSS